MDLLGEILGWLRVEGTILCRAELTDPWCLRKNRLDRAHFHVVVEGPCRLDVEGHRGPIALGVGDLVILPHGTPHLLSGMTGSPAVAFVDLLAAAGTSGDSRPAGQDSPVALTHGGGGRTTGLIMGLFSFRDRLRNPMLTSLPEVIHVKGEDGRAVPWLEATLGSLCSEVASGLPASRAVAARLADILFIQAVRAHAILRPGEATGWLGGMADVQVGRALALIHGQPGSAWSLVTLAGRSGMSRSAFAHRFREVVGEPPMEYLASWRMYVATAMMRDGVGPLREVAARVGYGSEVYFSKAFKRWAGISPGEYRRRMAGIVGQAEEVSS